MIKWPTESKLNELSCSPNKSENNPRRHNKAGETGSPVQCNKINTCPKNEQSSCSCDENTTMTEENSCESKPHDKQIPYTSRQHTRSPGTSDPHQRTPCTSDPHKRTPHTSEPHKRTPCTSEQQERTPCMRGPHENGALNSQANPQCPTVNPVDRINEEGLQSRYSNKLGPIAEERRPNRGRKQSENAVPGPSSGGYQPDFYDDSADMRNWQEHSNRQRRLQKKRSTGNEERRQRGLPPDLCPSVEANRTAPRMAPRTMPAGQMDRDRPTTRRRAQEQVPVRDDSRLQHLQNRLQLLKRVEHIKRTLLAEIQEEKQQPRPEELQQLRQRKIDSEKQKLSEMRRRLETRQQLEQQDTEQQPFDDQAASSQMCTPNATAYRHPLPAPNRPATADQQPRRKLYYKPTAIDSTHTETPERRSGNPGAARQTAPASSGTQKRRVPYQPPLQSDSSSSGGECNRQIPAPPFANATTLSPGPQRRAMSAGHSMFNNDYRQLANRRDNGVRTRPRSMGVAPATVPADSPGYNYDTVARDGNPRLVPQTLNFVCNCDGRD